MYLFIQICLYVNSYLQSALGQERINFSLNHNDTLLLKVKFSFKYRRETCWELEQAGVSEMLHDEKKKKVTQPLLDLSSSGKNSTSFTYVTHSFGD